MIHDPAETREAKFDPTKPARTRDGREVIIEVGLTFTYGRVQGEVGKEHIWWTNNGQVWSREPADRNPDLDLVNINVTPQPAADARADDAVALIDNLLRDWAEPEDNMERLPYREMAEKIVSAVSEMIRARFAPPQAAPETIEDPQSRVDRIVAGLPVISDDDCVWILENSTPMPSTGGSRIQPAYRAGGPAGGEDDAALYEEIVDACDYYDAADAQAIGRRVIARLGASRGVSEAEAAIASELSMKASEVDIAHAKTWEAAARYVRNRRHAARAAQELR